MIRYIQRLALFVIVFFAFSASPAFAALPTPTLLCLSVQDDGSILARWEGEDETLFDGFRLYYRPVTIPPQPSFDELNFTKAETSGTIPVADAKETQYEVFIITYDETDVASSQTLKTIKPDVYPQAGSNGGVAVVEWGAMNNTTSKVYRSIDNGATYALLGETSTNQYTDIIEGICQPRDLYYYVEFTNDNCTFRSMTGSVSGMSDNTAPADPIFEYVTINEDGYAVLNWALFNATDIFNYQIEVKDGLNWVEHATAGLTNSFTDDPLLYPDNYQNPCEQIISYVLKAVDQCENSSAQNVYSPTSILNTIWLRVDLDGNCQRKASLTWNRYNNMNPPVLSYNIYRSEQGAEPIEIANIADDGSELFTFTDDELLEPGHLFTYHIEATNAASRVSSSCRVDVYPDPDLLNTFELENVTVFNNDYIQLMGNGDPTIFINEVVIYRSNTTADELKPLMTTSWDSPGMIIPETSANVNDSAYYYQIVALDACGFPMDSSNVFRSIHLELQDMGEGNVRLNWNAFEGWVENEESHLAEYAIVRLIDGVIDVGYPQYRAPDTLVYNDYVDPSTETGRITYYVEGIRDDQVKSRSNEVLLPGEAEIVLPNAFKPDSDFEINQIFLPLVKNVEPSSYLFTVYNRWGQLVFETNDPSTGWDGTINGTVSPAGIYAYQVIYSDFNGNTFSQRGAVTLLR